MHSGFPYIFPLLAGHHQVPLCVHASKPRLLERIVVVAPQSPPSLHFCFHFLVLLQVAPAYDENTQCVDLKGDVVKKKKKKKKEQKPTD